jgi:hypothetical protein
LPSDLSPPFQPEADTGSRSSLEAAGELAMTSTARKQDWTRLRFAGLNET